MTEPRYAGECRHCHRAVQECPLPGCGVWLDADGGAFCPDGRTVHDVLVEV